MQAVYLLCNICIKLNVQGVSVMKLFTKKIKLYLERLMKNKSKLV